MQSHCERCVWGCILVQAAWQVVAAEDCPSSPMGSRSANSEQPCAVQRDCVGLLPFSSLQSRVCALA